MDKLTKQINKNVRYQPFVRGTSGRLVDAVPWRQCHAFAPCHAGWREGGKGGGGGGGGRGGERSCDHLAKYIYQSTNPVLDVHDTLYLLLVPMHSIRSNEEAISPSVKHSSMLACFGEGQEGKGGGGGGGGSCLTLGMISRKSDS